MREKTVWILQLVNCRTLMSDQALSINQKLVLFGLAPENQMVLKHQRLQMRAGLLLKKQCRRQAADSPANNHAVVELAGINNVLRKRIVDPVSNGVPGLKHPKRISVRSAVFPNATIAGELIHACFCKQLRWSGSCKQGRPRSQQRGAKKVAPSYRIVHTSSEVRRRL